MRLDAGGYGKVGVLKWWRATLAVGLALSAVSAHALDEGLSRVTTAVGQLNSWRAAPEVVLRHCKIHVPGKAPELDAAYDEWKKRNAAVLVEVADVTEKSLPIFSRLLGMTLEETRAWQADTVALGVEEGYFWRKGRLEIYSMCSNYPGWVRGLEGEAQSNAIRSRLESVRNALGNGQAGNAASR